MPFRCSMQRGKQELTGLRDWDCVYVCAQPVLKTLLINRLITFQSPRALSSVLSQPPEESLVILVCSKGSHPWKQDPEVTLPVPAGPVTCIRKQVQCGKDREQLHGFRSLDGAETGGGKPWSSDETVWPNMNKTKRCDINYQFTLQIK